MKELNIGRILIENRHKRGVTQDELANYIGVSKASVSKWENAVTYPDITILPKLAAFFNISIDELMGYEPQLTKEEIRKLYRQLSSEFSSRPFHEVTEHCRKIVKKYFSCLPLLFQIGALYVNHNMLAESPEQSANLLEEAAGLFVRVQKESDDLELAKMALHMQALCLLSLGRVNEVFDLLEPLELSPLSPEPLLSSAYQAIGNTKEAKKILQVGIYQSLVQLFSLLSSYMGLCLDDQAAFEESYRRSLAIAEVFQLKALHPSLLMTLYLSGAQGFITLGEEEKALDLLEQYAKLVTDNIYPLRLQGDSYFYLLGDWLEASLTLGCDLPRDETLVRKSMIEAVTDNPTFLPLAQNPHFQNILHCLKQMQRSPVE